MPYKHPRPQIGLKFTEEEYTQLVAEAERAGVPVHVYVRQLVQTRGQQPLEAQAQAVQAYYQLRERAHQEVLQEYAAAAYQARALQHQQTFFREQFTVIEYCLRHEQHELLQQALAEALAHPVITVVLPGDATPTLPPDPLG